MRSISYIFAPEDNLVAATINLFKQLNVHIPVKNIRDTLLGNPDYPSLLAVSDSLERLGIVSEAYQLSGDDLEKVPVPFLAHFKSGSFVTVTAVGEGVTYLEDDRSLKRISRTDFLYRWSGAVLLAEKPDETFNQTHSAAYFKENLKVARIPVFLFLLLLLATARFISISGRFSNTDSISFYSFGVLTGLGLFISALLMWHNYDDKNAYLEKICSFSKKTDCSAVLNSKASGVLGFSWSEIGFFYFLGSMICLLNSNHDKLHLLILINILSLPYIAFSIYYQAFVVKKWCVLCIGIQIILLAEFITSLITSQLNSPIFPEWKYVSYGLYLTAFIVPIIFWAIIKPVLYNFKNIEKSAYGFRRLKGNHEIFSAFLDHQRPIVNDPAGLGITLGDPTAKNTLIKVCNPYCGPCAKSFPNIQDLLKNNPNWKVQIIFTATPDENDSRSLPVAHFLQLNDIEDSNSMTDVLADWYNAEVKDYQLYAARRSVNVDFEQQKSRIAAMNTWCIKENIEHTPTYFTNGKLMHDNYNIEDLVFLM